MIFKGVFLRGFITLQNYVNAELDKTEMLMNLKKTESYQRKYNTIKKYRMLKKILEAFLNIVAIFKINAINSKVFFGFIGRASRICSHCLLISCAIIVVFSTRTFRNLD